MFVKVFLKIEFLLLKNIILLELPDNRSEAELFLLIVFISLGTDILLKIFLDLSLIFWIT